MRLRPEAQGLRIWPRWPWPDTREFSWGQKASLPYCGGAASVRNMNVMRWAGLEGNGAWRLAEAFTFAVVSIAYIWVRPLWWSWSLLIPLALVAVSFVWHSETAESLGFGLRAFLGAVAAWRW